jgi:hypothetical protein
LVLVVLRDFKTPKKWFNSPEFSGQVTHLIDSDLSQPRGELGGIFLIFFSLLIPCAAEISNSSILIGVVMTLIL